MVIWSRPARDDLRAIYDFIALESDFYAKKVVEELIELSETLETFPERGRAVPEFQDPRVRELFLYAYRLIYEISSERISVLAVIHSRRDISSL